MQPTLRESKKARTREALVAAAMRLFKERGFEGTTVDDIAAEAEVSRRTFFRYFATKELVVFPDREEQIAYFVELLAHPAAGETPFQTVRRAILDLARHFVANREEYLEQRRLVDATPQLIANDFESDQDWELAIARALDRDWDRPPGVTKDVSRRARVLAGATMGMIRACLTDWRAGGGQEDLIALGEWSLGLIELGIGAATSERPPAPSEPPPGAESSEPR